MILPPMILPKRCAAFLLLAFCFQLSVFAASTITATLSITNTPATSNNVQMTAGDLRIWTNNTVASTAFIPTTNSPATAATNLYVNLSAVLPTNLNSVAVSGTNVTLYGKSGAPLSLSLGGGWAEVTYVTNTSASAQTVVVPYTGVGTNSQTNVASGLVQWLEVGKNTNSFSATNSALSNFVNRSEAQVISGSKTFTGTNTILANLSLSNAALRFTGTGTIIGPDATSYTLGSNLSSTVPTQGSVTSIVNALAATAAALTNMSNSLAGAKVANTNGTVENSLTLTPDETAGDAADFRWLTTNNTTQFDITGYGGVAPVMSFAATIAGEDFQALSTTLHGRLFAPTNGATDGIAVWSATELISSSLHLSNYVDMITPQTLRTNKYWELTNAVIVRGAGTAAANGTYWQIAAGADPCSMGVVAGGYYTNGSYWLVTDGLIGSYLYDSDTCATLYVTTDTTVISTIWTAGDTGVAPLPSTAFARYSLAPGDTDTVLTARDAAYLATTNSVATEVTAQMTAPTNTLASNVVARASGVATNLTAYGASLTLSAGLLAPAFAVTTIGSGYAADVPIGSNLLVTVTTTSGIWTNVGLADTTANKLIVLVNLSSYDGAVLHDSGLEGTAGRRIYLLGQTNRVLSAGGGSVILWYNGTSSRWQEIKP